MGEQKRKQAAVYQQPGQWPGGRARCPKCFGTQVACRPLPEETEFYARDLAICASCAIAWEPIDEALIWDRDDPMCTTKEPCDNCAFRPGSHEQADKAAWKIKIESLRQGGIFYCHKGVPLAPGTEDGFAYPTTTTVVMGREIVIKDVANMRICKGYMKARRRWMWDWLEDTA
jgi:hypothetical protein